MATSDNQKRAAAIAARRSAVGDRDADKAHFTQSGQPRSSGTDDVAGRFVRSWLRRLIRPAGHDTSDLAQGDIDRRPQPEPPSAPSARRSNVASPLDDIYFNDREYNDHSADPSPNEHPDEFAAPQVLQGFRPLRAAAGEGDTGGLNALDTEPVRDDDLADSAPPQHMRYRPLDAPPEKAAPQTPEHNGIAPPVEDKPRVVASIGDLLERMRYEAGKDGSVLYFVDDAAAFRDHGDQLLMEPTADKNERAILAAVLLAKEKYGGAFEITGDAAFKQRVIEVMLKYDQDARLKNPEQDALRRELARNGQPATFPPATASAPVKPIDPRLLARAIQPIDVEDIPVHTAPATDQRPVRDSTRVRNDQQRVNSETGGRGLPAPAASTTSASESATARTQITEGWNDATYGERLHTADPINRLAGKIIEFGSAPFDHLQENSQSFYITLENEDGRIRTTWGVDLERVLELTRAKTGDHVVLHRIGRQAVTFSDTEYDEHGQAIGTRARKGHKVLWEIDVTGRHSKTQTREIEPPGRKPTPRPDAPAANASARENKQSRQEAAVSAIPATDRSQTHQPNIDRESNKRRPRIRP